MERSPSFMTVFLLVALLIGFPMYWVATMIESKYCKNEEEDEDDQDFQTLGLDDEEGLIDLVGPFEKNADEQLSLRVANGDLMGSDNFEKNSRVLRYKSKEDVLNLNAHENMDKNFDLNEDFKIASRQNSKNGQTLDAKSKSMWSKASPSKISKVIQKMQLDQEEEQKGSTPERQNSKQSNKSNSSIQQAQS